MINSLRKALWLGLATLTVFLINAWQHDYPALKQPLSPQQQSVVTLKEKKQAQLLALTAPIPAERKITFETDTIKGIIDKKGGDLVYLELLNQAANLDSKGNPLKPYVLLDAKLDHYAIAQTDILDSNEDKPLYQSEQTHYSLSSKNALTIELQRKENGITVKKQFVLRPSQYQIDVNYQIVNEGEMAWQGRLYAQLKQHIMPKKGWFSSASYPQSVLSTDEKPYETLKLKDFGRGRTSVINWLSFSEPYFASAWISKLSAATCYTNSKNDIYVLGMCSDVLNVLPSATQTASLKLYVGPKSTPILSKSAQHLDLLVDYGFFWFVAKPLLWLLQLFHAWIGNWGWAIVCCSLLMKSLFYPISSKGIRSMVGIQKLKAQLDAINARYSHDSQRLLQAQSALYKRNNISPLRSALSQLLQLPLFAASRTVLDGSIDLRHEPFIFWIKDLTASDPYYILPLFFALTFLMQSIASGSDQLMTPENQVLRWMLPCVLAFIFASSSSGFLVYWVVQNLCSSLERWWVLGFPSFKFLKRFAK